MSHKDNDRVVRLRQWGLLKGRIIAVVHTEREDYTRIISARKAKKYEI
ncbi:MAG: BrnT family toxin [Microcystis aeruginosa WS75]|nr:BrnT family toxin [Microcystis aeruginosa WS75]